VLGIVEGGINPQSSDYFQKLFKIDSYSMFIEILTEGCRMKNVMMVIILLTIAGGAVGAVASTTSKTVQPEFPGVQHTIYPVYTRS
jgi:hypothetical protein